MKRVVKNLSVQNIIDRKALKKYTRRFSEVEDSEIEDSEFEESEKEECTHLGEEDPVTDVLLARVAGAVEAVHTDHVHPKLLRALGVPNRHAFVDHKGPGRLELLHKRFETFKVPRGLNQPQLA